MRFLFFFTFALLPRDTPASPNHDEVQAGTEVQRSWQQYGQHDRTARSLDAVGSDTCEQVHARSLESIRIGWELADVASVPAATQEFINNVLMAQAASYWMSALNVRRASGPLRANPAGAQCTKFSFETSYTCTSAAAPTCGGDGVTIPARYLNSKKVCSKRCAPSYSCSGPSACFSGNSGASCNCDLTQWKSQGSGYCCNSFTAGASCPSSCSLSSVIDFGSGNGICEECTTEPEGPGAVDYDFYAFVTAKDSDSCSGSTQAYASTCVKDQCDRPIFAHVNFCLSKISLIAEEATDQVATAIHELAHALGFSSGQFKYFRNADGTPKIARDASDDTVLQGEIKWSCSGQTATWNDNSGNRRHSDLSAANIVKTFSERGMASCPCPIGKNTLATGCIVAQSPSFREPSCVMKLVTPKVLEKVREHFDCTTLNGAELENQPTSECSIVGSHWEQRIFMSEVMAPVHSLGPAFVSAVTLALFEDSGWYVPNYEQADTLVKGVHWGYHQGCSFATGSCISGGSTSFPRHWCTVSGTSACSLDRVGVRSCSTDTFGTALPSHVAYFSDAKAGTLAEADYCPFYGTKITNRVCTNPSSAYSPYYNVNFMRETFGAGSRCLDTTLRADVTSGGSTYTANSADFASAQPGCFEVACNTDDTAYDVSISDLAGSTVAFGTCTSAGQSLTGGGLQGQLTCASPSELCGVVLSKLSNVTPAAIGPTPAPWVAPAPTPTATHNTTVASALLDSARVEKIWLLCAMWLCLHGLLATTQAVLSDGWH